MAAGDADDGGAAGAPARASRHRRERASLPERRRGPRHRRVWTCNHCPYALALARPPGRGGGDYGASGRRVPAVNSNDAERYPARLAGRDARAGSRGTVAVSLSPRRKPGGGRAWAAQVTPHVYVLDGDLRIRYEGAPDADHMDPSQDAAWLREALDAVLAGETPGAAGDRARRMLDQVEALR